MEIRVKVTCDGNHFVGSLPRSSSGIHYKKSYRSKKNELFNVYYLEAQKNGVSRSEIVEYISSCFMRDLDISEWLSNNEIEELLKNKKRNDHKRKKRYLNKLFLVDWNYYVTFTYDDQKETRESFSSRLKKTFSNFKTRHNWLVMAIPEEGEETGRLHYHCFLYIPEGEMVGNLFLQKKYSNKKRRMITWTDNSYFSERFGQSVWKAINRNDLRGNSLKSYLVKYLSKSGNKFFYSRGIPTELDMIIDTDTDVFCTYNNYGLKVLLFDYLIFGDMNSKDFNLTDLLCFDRDMIYGYNIADCPTVAQCMCNCFLPFLVYSICICFMRQVRGSTPPR